MPPAFSFPFIRRLASYVANLDKPDQQAFSLYIFTDFVARSAQLRYPHSQQFATYGDLYRHNIQHGIRNITAGILGTVSSAVLFALLQRRQSGAVDVRGERVDAVRPPRETGPVHRKGAYVAEQLQHENPGWSEDEKIWSDG
jgi:hypothetical protein